MPAILPHLVPAPPAAPHAPRARVRRAGLGVPLVQRCPAASCRSRWESGPCRLSEAQRMCASWVMCWMSRVREPPVGGRFDSLQKFLRQRHSASRDSFNWAVMLCSIFSELGSPFRFPSNAEQVDHQAVTATSCMSATSSIDPSSMWDGSWRTQASFTPSTLMPLFLATSMCSCSADVGIWLL